MFRRGGIFSGFGGLGAMGAENLFVALDPKAGKGVPFTTLLQTVMQQQGATKVVPDGQWGQCSHSAFKKTFGVEPSYDSLSQLFSIDKFGVPPQNVSVWKPGATDLCWNGSDKYEPPPVEQQLANPDPAFLLANVFGLPLPAGLCPGGRIPSMTAKKCVCPSGTYENVNTGNCDQFESPQQVGPTTGTTTPGSVPPKIAPKIPPKIKVVTGVPGTATPPRTLLVPPLRTGGGPITTYPCPVDHPYYKPGSPMGAMCGPNKNAYPVTIGGKMTGAYKCIGGATPVQGTLTNGKPGMTCPLTAVAPAIGSGVSLVGSRRITGIGPITGGGGGGGMVTPSLTPPSGMTTGTKILLGVVAVAALGGGAWYFLRAKPSAEAVANRRRRRRRSRRRMRCNCGYRSNCGE